ncbi:cytochrome c family protein [Pseudoxanthomonas sp. PXM01]|uniref:cytochrome c family protein n=1 Tax=Pseudoxanthomonas sp. PXM01 TaxID=2769295 RepID=UPI001CE225C1|nr:cytochrome c family protein [Pseudoxanthomonas sp. PXM01]
MRTLRFLPLPVLLMAMVACQPEAPRAMASLPAQAPSEADLLARGEYLVRIAGCNDCHTPGYAQAGGEVAKDAWLVGSPMGFNGPWGTTYATNLRLRMQELSEAQWMEYSANLRTRPMMPDFAVRAMTEDDRRAIYRFVHALGTAGQPAPEALPPGTPPPAPYFGMVLPTGPEAPATK